MANFWKLVNRIIAQSDIILEVIDARFPEASRNPEIEKKIEKAGKKYIIVANKSDLAGKDPNDFPGFPNGILVSSHEKLGTTVLRKKILALGKGKPVVVGVVGYPNTGKSSVINALAGRGKAKTSSVSGYTKSLQKVRAGPKIMLIDTPGVIPFNTGDETSLALMGSVSANQLKDPIAAAVELIEGQKNLISAYYSVEEGNTDEMIDAIAIKLNLLERGGVPNTRLASIKIIEDWQKAKIRR